MLYSSAQAWPFESTKRSRLIHLGSDGLYFITCVHSRYAMGARPMGALHRHHKQSCQVCISSLYRAQGSGMGGGLTTYPGWPELAFCTISAASTRIVLIDLTASSVA